MSKTAVILAGGLGSRLAPFTLETPKSLLPVKGMPILEIIIRQLVGAGFDRLILAVNHHADLILDFCGDGTKWGCSIESVRELKPLGTIGPIKQISNPPENFLIINSDILTDFDLGGFFDFHVENSHLFTTACFEQVETSEYGVLRIENGALVGFEEKPIRKMSVNMGIYMANRDVLGVIPPDVFFGFDHLVLKLLSQKLTIHTALHRGHWIDIGSIKNYEKVQL